MNVYEEASNGEPLVILVVQALLAQLEGLDLGKIYFVGLRFLLVMLHLLSKVCGSAAFNLIE
jgi:hypothetical protein